MYKHHSMPMNHHHMHYFKHLCQSEKIMISTIIVVSFVRGICIGMYLGEK